MNTCRIWLVIQLIRHSRRIPLPGTDSRCNSRLRAPSHEDISHFTTVREKQKLSVQGESYTIPISQLLAPWPKDRPSTKLIAWSAMEHTEKETDQLLERSLHPPPIPRSAYFLFQKEE